jgi:hypothetical protein
MSCKNLKCQKKKAILHNLIVSDHADFALLRNMNTAPLTIHPSARETARGVDVSDVLFYF